MTRKSSFEAVFIRNDDELDENGERSFSLLRFYNDGTVLSAGLGACNLLGDWPKINNGLIGKRITPKWMSELAHLKMASHLFRTY